MAQRITVNDLIDEVRGQLDEENVTVVDDAGDILPALNRAQNYAADILARHYKEPLLASASISLASGEDTFSIPEDAFEQRLLKVEVNQNGTYYDLTRIDFQDIAQHEVSSQTVSLPYFYSIIGQEVKVLPASSGTYPLRIWYLRDPLPLTKLEGRINIINTAGNYVIVDSVGDGLSAESDQLASFVNLIDGATGLRKGTLQIQSISSNRITFKSSPTRPSVLDLSVGTTITGLGIEVDDYLCLSHGTCVPFLKKPLANFYIQYAVAELSRKLQREAATEQQVLQLFETQVERAWVQRPNGIRVRKRNNTWAAVPFRRVT